MQPYEREKPGTGSAHLFEVLRLPLTTVKNMNQVLSVYAQQTRAHLSRYGLQATVLTALAGTPHFNQNKMSYPSICVSLPMDLCVPAHAHLIPGVIASSCHHFVRANP